MIKIEIIRIICIALRSINTRVLTDETHERFAEIFHKAVNTHDYAVQLSLCPLTSMNSVVYLFPKAIFKHKI